MKMMFRSLGLIFTVVVSSCLRYATALSTFQLGNGFTLSLDPLKEILQIKSQKKIIWETVPGEDFLSATSGNDQIINSQGNFKITQIDQAKCGGLKIDRGSYEPENQSVIGKAVSIQGELLECGRSSFAISFWAPKDLPDRVAFRIAVEPDLSEEDPVSKLLLTFRSDPSEDFYGLGAQASFASLKHHAVPIFSREQGVGRGDQPTTALEDAASFFSGGDQYTTYTAIPQYITSTGRAFYLIKDNTAYSIFDFRDPEAITIRYDGLSLSGHLLQAEDMLNAITMVTAYTGTMPELPRWVDSGAVLGIQGGEQKVEKIIQEALSNDCPTAGVWLQDWTGQHSQSVPLVNVNITRVWWNWEADRDLYPNWIEFVQSLRERYGVKTLSYINTFLTNVSSKPDGFRRNLFLEASNSEYLIQNSTTNATSIVSSGPGIDAGIIDLTNPSARRWFQDVLLDQVWNANISGFMCDFGEYTPTLSDTKFYNRSIDPLLYHNEYPRDWAILQRQTIQEAPGSTEIVIFHRSASLGSNAHMNLYWAGDQDTTWDLNDGIKSAVTVMGHMGMCGYTQGHSDIGGYTTTFEIPSLLNPSGVVNRSAELLGRWSELAAISSAMFRSHEGSVPEANAQFYTDASTYTYFAYCTRLFRSLASYRRRVLETESLKKGWPLLRMPVLYHSNDPIAKEISHQSFYFGPDLYVAPVLDPGKIELDVYLPGDCNRQTYTHVWTLAVYTAGQTVRVPTPYGKPAIFMVNNPSSPDLHDFLEFVREENDTIIGVRL